MPLMTMLTMQLKGRDLATGLPKTIIVNSDQILDAMHESIEKIVEAVKASLEKTPPELAADIMQKGIVLTGGGALIKNLDKLLMQETKMPVYVIDDPLDAVVRGTEKVLENIERLSSVLMSSRR